MKQNSSYVGSPYDLGTKCGHSIPLADRTLPRRKRSAEVPCLGTGGSVVDMILELQQEVGRSFHLAFDNVLTSLKLVDCLSKKKHCLHRNNPRQQNRGLSTEVCEGDGKV